MIDRRQVDALVPRMHDQSVTYLVMEAQLKSAIPCGRLLASAGERSPGGDVTWSGSDVGGGKCPGVAAPGEGLGE